MDNNFQAQLISRGSYVDTDPSYMGWAYLVTTYVLRLNPAGLNEYILSSVLSDRYSFATDSEWEEHKAKKKHLQAEFTERIRESLGIPQVLNPVITQSLSEVFTAVTIEEFRKKGKNV